MSVRQERKDAAEHRKLILKTAQSLFAAYGVDQVSMHQIAKTAGIGQGTLYRRYTHKGDLCLDLIQDSCHTFIEQLSARLREAADRPVMDRVAAIVNGWVDFIEERAPWLYALQSNNPCEERRTVYYRSPIYLYMHETICGLLKQAAAGEDGSSNGGNGSAPDADTAFTAHAVLSSFDPNFYFLIRREQNRTPDDFKRHLTEHLGRLFSNRN